MQRRFGLERRPCGVCDDGNAGPQQCGVLLIAVEDERIFHPRHLFNLVEISALHASAKGRAALIRSIKHTRQRLIDAEQRLARVDAADALANELKVAAVLQGDGFDVGHRQGGGLAD